MTPDPAEGLSPEEDPGPADSEPTTPGEGSSPDDTDVDAVFAELVAQFAQEDDAVGPWPVAEEVSEEPPQDPEPPSSAVSVMPSPAPADPATDPGSQAEGFVPPDPPLPSGSLLGRLAWIGVIGGPSCLLFLVIVGFPVTGLFLAVPLGAFVAGFLTLLARLPSERPDDPDDGAVI